MTNVRFLCLLCNIVVYLLPYHPAVGILWSMFFLSLTYLWVKCKVRVGLDFERYINAIN
jgi:hypothetical protein